MALRRRQDAKSVCVKRRHGAMSAGEVLEEELCLKAVALLCLVADEEDNEEDEGDLLVVAALIAAGVEERRVDLTIILPVRRHELTIDDISEQDATTSYRFRKPDLRRLFVVLGFPDVWVCKNRARFHGESALLLLLRRSRCGKLSSLESRGWCVCISRSNVIFEILKYTDQCCGILGAR